MKKINEMKFITEMIVLIRESIKAITADDCDKWEFALQRAKYTLGQIDSLITFTNCMVATENNEFTADMNEVEDELNADTYQAIAQAAIKFERDNETIAKYFEKRNSYRS